MNRITLYFTPCSPPPPGGYEILYKVVGFTGAHTNAGVFFQSPAVFYDPVNPIGTCYDGLIRSVCGDAFGTPVMWENCGSGDPPDNSSCGTDISITTTDPAYMDLGLYDLHVDATPHVYIYWFTYDRPNRFTLYDNGNILQSLGWKGVVTYPGPWGASLSTAESGTMDFVPIPGHLYQIKIEAGPADPSDVIDDNFLLQIRCS